MRGKSDIEGVLRAGTFAFAVALPIMSDSFPKAIYELGRTMRNALDAAEHGPGAEELDRWADDGGYVPDMLNV